MTRVGPFCSGSVTASARCVSAGATRGAAAPFLQYIVHVTGLMPACEALSRCARLAEAARAGIGPA